MPLVINTNLMSLTAHRHVAGNTQMLSKSMEKLASGFRINKAGDDAAGLQLSENLRAQIRGSQKALENTQDAINLLNILDGVHQTMHDSMQRIRELVIQGANDTYSASQRLVIREEIRQIHFEMGRVLGSTQFNGVALTGVPATIQNLNIQVGANSGDTLDLSDVLGDAVANTMLQDGTGLKMYSPLYLNGNRDTWTDYLSNTTTPPAIFYATEMGVDPGMQQLNIMRGRLGAAVNRLEGIATNLQLNIENLSAAESRIRDVDVAEESAKLTRAQILQQSSAAMLSQANISPNIALQLLQG